MWLYIREGSKYSRTSNCISLKQSNFQVHLLLKSSKRYVLIHWLNERLHFSLQWHLSWNCLWRFQTDAPMAPFLHPKIYNILRVFMRRFLKTDMDEVTTPRAMIKLDIKSKKVLREPKDFDIRTKASGLLEKKFLLMKKAHLEKNVMTSSALLLQKSLNICDVSRVSLGDRYIHRTHEGTTMVGAEGVYFQNLCLRMLPGPACS